MITLDGLDVPMPKGWAETLLKKSFEESAVGKLSGAVPMPLDGLNVPIYEGGFEVGYVAEGTRKPVSTPETRINTITPKKFAGIVVVSQEIVRRNPAAMLDFIEADMRNGVSRQVDYAVLYGKSALTGNAVPETTSVNATTSRVELTTGDLVPQLIGAYDLAVAGSNDPTGWAFDSRFRSRIAVASQQQLAPAGGTQSMPNLGLNIETFAGLPAAFSRVVAGRIGANPETKVRGFVGDWSKIRWGFSENLKITRSKEATIVDGDTTLNLFQDNLMALRIEFELGWWVQSSAFAAVEDLVA